MEMSVTIILLNSVEDQWFIELSIVGIDWKLLSYWKCDRYDFFLEWVIGYILLGLLPRQWNWTNLSRWSSEHDKIYWYDDDYKQWWLDIYSNGGDSST